MRSTVASGQVPRALAARSSTPTRSRPGSPSGVLLLTGRRSSQTETAPSARTAASRQWSASAESAGSQAMAKQRPGQLGLEHLDGRVLELGLLGGGAIRRGGERVHACQAVRRWTLQPLKNSAAPVHGHERLRQVERWCRALRGHHDGAALARHVAPGRRSFRPRRSMSCGCSCTLKARPHGRTGGPSVPVRVMPCHWSRRRPVVRLRGVSATRAARPWACQAQRGKTGACHRGWGTRRLRTGGPCPWWIPQAMATVGGLADSSVLPRQTGDVQVTATRVLSRCSFHTVSAPWSASSVV